LIGGFGLWFLSAVIFPQIATFIFSQVLNRILGERFLSARTYGLAIFFTFFMTAIGSFLGVWFVGYFQTKKYPLVTFLFTCGVSLFALVMGIFLPWYPLFSLLLPPIGAMVGFELGYLLREKAGKVQR
jgi:CHASE2 domain-containing sensor protein